MAGGGLWEQIVAYKHNRPATDIPSPPKKS